MRLHAQNYLASGIGKYAEPSCWYRHIKENFFKPRGYQLIGDPQIVGEFEVDLWALDEARHQERIEWRKRVKELTSDEYTP